MPLFQQALRLKPIHQLAMTFACVVLLSACGRSTGLNQSSALPIPQQNAGSSTYAANPNLAGTPQYAYPTPQLQGNASAQANPGGRAVATPNGYVYEQNPLANSTAYNYYNSQNPCLYPQPGQSTSGCGGNGSYYAPQAGSTTYPQQNPTQVYGQSYPQTYPQAPTQAYGQTPNPYAGGSVAAPQSYPNAQTNPYAGNTVAQQSVPQQPIIQSSADKARSRIDTRPAGSTGTQSNNKSLSF